MPIPTMERIIERNCKRSPNNGTNRNFTARKIYTDDAIVEEIIDDIIDEYNFLSRKELASPTIIGPSIGNHQIAKAKGMEYFRDLIRKNSILKIKSISFILFS